MGDGEMIDLSDHYAKTKFAAHELLAAAESWERFAAELENNVLRRSQMELCRSVARDLRAEAARVPSPASANKGS